MNNNFIKRRALKMATQAVTSKTMNSIKPVSRGGTKVVSMLDLQIAAIEMSKTIRGTQIALRGKEDKIWRADILTLNNRSTS